METMSSKILLSLMLTVLLQQSLQLSLENCNIIIHERKELHLRCKSRLKIQITIKELHLRYKSRLKRTNGRTLYYFNSVASFNIVLSSDVEKNP